jgi:hypothetical protein
MKRARLPFCFLLTLALFSVLAGEALAADLSSWHLRNMSLEAAASGGGIYVAVGEDGFILRSINGTTWTQVSSGVEDDLWDVAYGNGVFVVVGGNTVLVSSDGLTWNQYAPPAGFSSYSITFGNGMFVAADSSDSVFTSPDGITWTDVTLSSSTTFTDITYGGGLFVVVGYGGTIVTSPDASTWTPRISGTTRALWQATYKDTVPGLYVIVGESGTVLTSSDGFTWRAPVIGISQTLMTVGYGADGFVTSGSNSSSDAGHIWTSSNGTGWLEQISPAYEWFFDTLYAGGSYFLVGGKIITSTTGVDWSIVHGATGWDIWSVAYGNGVYAAGTMTGQIIISSDGIRWTQPTSYPDVTTIVDMAYCPTNQRFIGAVSDGTLLYSDDSGDTWKTHAFSSPVNLSGLSYVHDRFIGAGSNGTLITSPDGITWSSTTTPSTQTLQGATYGNNTFVIVGSGGEVVTSQDNGVTWVIQTPVTTDILYSVAYGNGTFVAAGGYSGDVITSADGINWTSHDGILPAHAFYSVTFYDDVFLAVGSYGDVYSSTDGAAWDSVNVPTDNTLFCGTADGPGFTAVGMNGTIIQLDAQPSYDATGTWDYTATNNWADGSDPGCTPPPDETGTVTITQTGNSFELVVDGETFTGTVSGATYTIFSSETVGGKTETLSITFTASSSSSGAGTLTWSWTDGVNWCEGGADLTFSKLGAAGAAEGGGGGGCFISATISD